MKIAVCMYGQPRTWETISAWVMESYKKIPGVTVVDFFLSVKNFNSNKKEGFLHEVPDSYFEHLVNTIKPVGYRFERRGEFLGHGAYSSTMLSMYSSLNLKQQYEMKTQQQYDVVIMQRLDCICGPYVNWFKKILEDGEIKPHTVYSNFIDSMFAAECAKMGINDRLFFGHNTAMDSLAGSILNTFNPGNWDHPKTADHHATSPGVMIRDLCLQTNIRLDVCDYKTLIIRDSFDMSKGVQYVMDNILDYEE